MHSSTHPGPVDPATGHWTGSNLLRWGAIDGSVATGTWSALEIANSPAGGSVATNAAFVPTNDYIHHNSAALGANSYTPGKTKIDSTLSLSAPGTQKQFASPYSVYFTEAPNTKDTCPSASGATPCSDIFVLVSGFGEWLAYRFFDLRRLVPKADIA